MGQRWDVCVVRDAAEEGGKSYWTKIGAAFESDKGNGVISIVLDALPVGNGSGQARMVLRYPFENDRQATSGSQGQREYGQRRAAPAAPGVSKGRQQHPGARRPPATPARERYQEDVGSGADETNSDDPLPF
jgi:hypothetical protein